MQLPHDKLVDRRWVSIFQSRVSAAQRCNSDRGCPSPQLFCRHRRLLRGLRTETNRDKSDQGRPVPTPPRAAIMRIFPRCARMSATLHNYPMFPSHLLHIHRVQLNLQPIGSWAKQARAELLGITKSCRTDHADMAPITTVAAGGLVSIAEELHPTWTEVYFLRRVC